MKMQNVSDWKLRIIFGACLFLGVFSPTKSLAQHDFGLGIVIGDPTGLTAKYNLSQGNAIDAALSFGGGGNFYLHGTYLWEKAPIFNIEKYPVNWYFGLGARIINHDHGDYHHYDDADHDTHLGARAPIGLRMNFNDPRIEIFTEISLTMDVLPKMAADVDFGIGARYYF